MPAAAAWPTRCATTSRCCWSTRPAGRPERGRSDMADLVRRVPARRRGRAGRGRRTRCAQLAEAGARVRREAVEAAPRRSPQAVAARRATPAARARSSPPARTPGCCARCSSRGARCRSWPGPGPALPGWAGGLDLVVVLAPDGADRGTASAVAEAVRRGCQVVVACPPGSLVAEHAAGRWSTIAADGDPRPAGHRGGGAGVPRPGRPRPARRPRATSPRRSTTWRSPARRTATSRSTPPRCWRSRSPTPTPLVWGGSVLAARAARRVAESIRRASAAVPRSPATPSTCCR